MANLGFPTIWQSQSSQEAQVSQRPCSKSLRQKLQGFLGPNLANSGRSAKVLSVAVMEVCNWKCLQERICPSAGSRGSHSSLQLACLKEPPQLLKEPLQPSRGCVPMPCTHKAPLSMKLSMQEYWCRLPFPAPGDLPRVCQGCVPPVRVWWGF